MCLICLRKNGDRMYRFPALSQCSVTNSIRIAHSSKKKDICREAIEGELIFLPQGIRDRLWPWNSTRQGSWISAFWPSKGNRVWCREAWLPECIKPATHNFNRWSTSTINQRKSYGTLQHVYFSAPWLSWDSYEYAVRCHSRLRSTASSWWRTHSNATVL